MSTIAFIASSLVTIPLLRPWGADVTDIHVITVDVHTTLGTVGHGFTWTPSIGSTAVKALLDADIGPFVVGRPTDAAALWPQLWAHLHEAGSGGITTIAMAGLDLALWDLAARERGLSISTFIGQRRDSVSCYASGVNFHYPIDELVRQVERWVAAGHTAVKIKVGKPTVGEDVDRVTAVRAVLGPDRKLMIDANQRWNLEQAIEGAAALAPLDIRWLEEPLRADDLLAHVALKQSTNIPIALGENVYTEHRFSEFLIARAVDVVQPNVVRVGGVTPFLRIAALAMQHGVALAPHLLPELSGQLALSIPQESVVEDVEDAGFGQLGALAAPSPVTISGNRLVATEHVGLGFHFVH